jgi:hypothetical protein
MWFVVHSRACRSGGRMTSPQPAIRKVLRRAIACPSWIACCFTMFGPASAWTTLSGVTLALGCSAEPSCTETLTCSAQGAGGHSSGGSPSEAGGNTVTSFLSTSTGGAMGGSTGGSIAVGGAVSVTSCSAVCPSAAPICDLTTSTCVTCLDDSDCPGIREHCDVERKRCVECTKSDHCGEDAAFCDAESGTCLQCRDSSDCTDPSSPLCVEGSCLPCTQNADCRNHGERALCDVGSCVECTIANEVPCGDRSCEPRTRRCTNVVRHSRSDCEPCSADSECKGAATDSSLCLPMTATGHFCLPTRQQRGSCPRPFSINDARVVSASETRVEYSCSLNVALTSCAAVRDYVNGVLCTKDADCGCIRNDVGGCVGPGAMGRCSLTLGASLYCSYACATNFDCPAGRTCGIGAEAYCH